MAAAAMGIASGAMGSVGGVAQMGIGVYQMVKAARQSKLQRPQYQIPSEVQQNLNAAQMRALEGLPEEQRKDFVQRIQRGSAQAAQMAGDRRSGLVGIAGIQQRESDAYNSLMAQDSAAKRQNELAVDANRQNLADYKERAWETNTMTPYLEAQQAQDALKASSIQNVFGGINSTTNSMAQGVNAAGVSQALGQQAPEAGVGSNYAGMPMAQNVIPANAAQQATQPTYINRPIDIQNTPASQYGTPMSVPNLTQINNQGLLLNGGQNPMAMNGINPQSPANLQSNLTYNPYAYNPIQY